MEAVYLQILVGIVGETLFLAFGYFLLLPFYPDPDAKAAALLILRFELWFSHIGLFDHSHQRQTLVEWMPAELACGPWANPALAAVILQTAGSSLVMLVLSECLSRHHNSHSWCQSLGWGTACLWHPKVSILMQW